ncbi:MAG TPA: PhoH family protein [Phycisphaerae bacterium]|nr:PhoH family protein [Phycisphaerae bacterium]
MELVITLNLADEERMELYGPADMNLRTLREALGVRIYARDSTLKVVGDSDSVSKAAAVIEVLQNRLQQRSHLTKEDIADAVGELALASRDEPGTIQVYRRSTKIRPKTPGQETYVQGIEKHDLCFCLGPAGTGKTYLAVAVALSLLKAGKLKRIVLARPAVEAGEKLGYLPGDMQAKVNPYLRPLFDAMHDMMEFEQIKRFMLNDVIEVIPLAFMRGRTLNNAAIILDEAQNATPQQMLMFLTRLGHHSKMIVTGDDSQSDLGDREKSGLVDAVRKLQGIDGIAVVRLTQADIVRHRLVTKIVSAYGNGGSQAPTPGKWAGRKQG